MKILSLCHTIIIEEKNGKKIYNAASPDELALLNFARFCGFEFLGINEHNQMTIEYKSNKERYKLLDILEFNSTRKRMSVILEDLQRDRIVLYCKGADNIILERC